MKYIKALIKTVNQMDDVDRMFFIGFACMIFGLISAFISNICKCEIITVLSVICIFYGLYKMFKGFWIEDGKEDFMKFINKVKKNIE